MCFHEHESLLDHKEDEELSEAERKAAWDEYEAEVRTCVACREKPHTVRLELYVNRCLFSFLSHS